MRAPAVVCASILLFAIAMISGAADTAVTARASLAAAIAAAQKWQPDAVLTGVSTMRASQDGRAASWDYMFHSPQAGKACSFMHAVGRPRRSRSMVRP